MGFNGIKIKEKIVSVSDKNTILIDNIDNSGKIGDSLIPVNENNKNDNTFLMFYNNEIVFKKIIDDVLSDETTWSSNKINNFVTSKIDDIVFIPVLDYISNKKYYKNQIILYENDLYLVKQDFISTNIANDINNIKKLNDSETSGGVNYKQVIFNNVKENDVKIINLENINKYNKHVFVLKKEILDLIVFNIIDVNENKWNKIGNIDFDNTIKLKYAYIFDTDIDNNVYITNEININDYADINLISIV